jgi:hypothetical protein
MLTIREQILQLIKTELARITTANGYHTNIGLHTVRGRYDLFPSELPAVMMIANQDTAEPRLGHSVLSIPLIVEGFQTFPNAYTDYSDRAARAAEAILGDILTCILSPRVTLDFHSGSREPALGTTLTGSSSGATSILESISLSSGSWAAGDAAGTLSVRLPWLNYTTEYLLNAGGETLASTTGSMITIPQFSDLLDHIEYQRGGIEPLPDPGEDILKVSASFAVYYAILAGNPYKQS